MGYIERILKGLKKHCTERKFPKFETVFARDSWDENLSPTSTPTYPMSIVLEQYRKHKMKRMNLRYKSIEKINLLIVDDDLGYFDHSDRVSGQIYQIPAWNGPIGKQLLANDAELVSLRTMIQSIVDKGSIQKY